jgi:hypothetical protein
VGKIADCGGRIGYDIMRGTIRAGHTSLEYATGLKIIGFFAIRANCS